MTPNKTPAAEENQLLAAGYMSVELLSKSVDISHWQAFSPAVKSSVYIKSAQRKKQQAWVNLKHQSSVFEHYKDNPHVPELVESDSIDELYYFAVKRPALPSLAEALKTLKLDFAKKKTLMEALIESCQSFHHGGYVHADLHPDNVLLQFIEGKPHFWLLDFEFSQKVGEARNTSYRSVPYSAKETSEQGQAVHCATDVYSLGRILLAIDSGYAALTSQSDDDRCSSFFAVIDKATRSDSQNRYQSSGALLDAVRLVNSELGSSNVQVPNKTNPRGSAHKTQKLIAVAPTLKSSRLAKFIAATAAVTTVSAVMWFSLSDKPVTTSEKSKAAPELIVSGKGSAEQSNTNAGESTPKSTLQPVKTGSELSRELQPAVNNKPKLGVASAAMAKRRGEAKQNQSAAGVLASKRGTTFAGQAATATQSTQANAIAKKKLKTTKKKRAVARSNRKTSRKKSSSFTVIKKTSKEL